MRSEPTAAPPGRGQGELFAESHGAAQPESDPGPRTPERGATPRRQPLWLALHLPWLAGEVLADGDPACLAVSQESRRGWLVYRASPQARRQGVWPGMTLSAAGVMCPGLAVRRRQPRREQQRLAEIGDWMRSFSPVVSLQPPETVLLEVRGSLGLFGGLAPLAGRLHERLDAAGHRHCLAGAPVPAAAQYLARWGRARMVESRAALRAALGDMPAALLALDARTHGRLRRTGVRTLRDLWRLPGDGLARRFGPAVTGELERLQGRRPDPRALHDAPRHFAAVLMLDWATADLAQIRQAAAQLLRQLAAELQRTARGTSAFSIECLSESGRHAARAQIELRQISRDREHLYRLAAERLARLRLPGPVTGLVLRSDHLHALQAGNGQLFETREERATQWRHSEEWVAMHLGGGRGLETLHQVAEHRPEYAWDTTPAPPTPGAGETPARRPLWLLDPPRSLAWPAQTGGWPRSLKLIRGPERIETGWWDGHDQRRDYYQVTDARGRRLWVFQELRGRRWFLHGLFG